MTEINSILDRLSEALLNKFSIAIGYVTAGGVTADAVVKKVDPEIVEKGLGLADWQIIISIVFLLAQIAAKLYKFYEWIKEKRKK